MSINKVILLGNVGKDPEIRYLDNGVCVAQFSLATTDRGYTTQDGKQIPDKTEWHDIVAWRGIAQTVEKYVRKGDKLYIEGKIKHSSYDDTKGVKRYRVDVYVETMELLTPKGEGKPLPPDPGAPANNLPFPEAKTPFGATETKAPSQPVNTAPAQPKQKQMDFSAEPKDDLPF